MTMAIDVDTIAVELREKAKALKPVLRERAADTERNRVVPTASIDDCREAGFFKIILREKFGGFELPPAVLYDVIMEVSAACASTGWVLAVLALHNWEGACLTERSQEEIWGDDPESLISSAYAPTGQVEKVDGGYRLTGNWPYSSGCDHSQWAFVGGLVSPVEGEPPVMSAFTVPMTDVEIVDDWNVVGLCGTGSKTLKLDAVFVPDYRLHAVFGAAERPTDDRSAIFKLPFGLVFLDSIASPALGAATDILDHYIERNKERLAAFDGAKFADNPDIHRYIAETEYVINAAKAARRRNQDVELAAATAGREVPVMQRARHLWETAKGVHSCVEAATRLFMTSGAHSTFLDNPLQRAMRDIQTAGTHAAFSFNAAGRNYGATHLGFENGSAFI